MTELLDPNYLGAPASYWTFLFGAISTFVVVVGVPVAIVTLRQANSQRLTNSMSKLFDEYREAVFRESFRQVMERFPLLEGSINERVAKFIDYGRKSLNSEDMRHARLVVNRLNDIGIFVERRSVREADFFGTLHPRIIEIGARLEMVILLVTARGESRWGMRVRRLASGATLYYRMSKVYNRGAFKKGDYVLVAAGKPPLRVRIGVRIRRSFGQLGYLKTSSRALNSETADIAAVSEALQAFSSSELEFLSK
jgi:hypothetical protein